MNLIKNVTRIFFRVMPELYVLYILLFVNQTNTLFSFLIISYFLYSFADLAVTFAYRDIRKYGLKIFLKQIPVMFFLIGFLIIAFATSIEFDLGITGVISLLLQNFVMVCIFTFAIIMHLTMQATRYHSFTSDQQDSDYLYHFRINTFKILFCVTIIPIASQVLSGLALHFFVVALFAYFLAAEIWYLYSCYVTSTIEQSGRLYSKLPNAFLFVVGFFLLLMSAIYMIN